MNNRIRKIIKRTLIRNLHLLFFLLHIYFSVSSIAKLTIAFSEKKYKRINLFRHLNVPIFSDKPFSKVPERASSCIRIILSDFFNFRPSRRSDDNRLLSPNGQRRNIPVSVFSPAKLDNKRPAPAPPPTYPYESQQPTSYLSRLPTNDHSYPTKLNEHEMNNKPSSGVKTPTGTLLNDFSVPTDKHDHTKKMNVFERLFRANKKKN